MDRIEARLATMTLSAEGRLIELHDREGLDLDVDGLMEVQLRRSELTTERCAMLAFFQPGTLADISVMNVDYFGKTNANAQLIALAIVTADNLGEAMSGIYYSYHPQTFPTCIFSNEKESRRWIAGELSNSFPTV